MRLLDAFHREITLIRPGSDQGQFPILDILGNLRDEAAAKVDVVFVCENEPVMAEIHVKYT